MIDLSLIRKAKTRIDPYVHKTPILTSSRLNEIANTDMYFKCENFQKSGSFKIRGATNTVLQLTSEELKRGIVTASSGNHGAALSMAVSRLGIKPKIVMPRNTPKVKINNVIRNGGQIIWCDPNQASREKDASKLKFYGGLAAALGFILQSANDRRRDKMMDNIFTVYRGLKISNHELILKYKE